MLGARAPALCGEQTSFELFSLHSSGGLEGSIAVSRPAGCSPCSAAHQTFTVVVVVVVGSDASSPSVLKPLKSTLLSYFRPNMCTPVSSAEMFTVGGLKHFYFTLKRRFVQESSRELERKRRYCTVGVVFCCIVFKTVFSAVLMQRS